MKVLIDKSFSKDVSKISDKKIRRAIANIIENIQDANKLSDINNLKKLKGTKNAYRIRLGSYRIGFFYINRQAELIRFLHRSQVYNKFP